MEKAWEETDHLLELYQRFEEAIALYLKVDLEEAKTVFETAELEESLKDLEKAAQSFNMERFFAWEKETEHMTAPEEYLENWNKLRDVVRNVAFSDTIDIIEAMLAKINEKKHD